MDTPAQLALTNTEANMTGQFKGVRAFPQHTGETQTLQLSQALLEQPLSSTHLLQPFADPAAPWVFFPDLEMGPVSAGNPLTGALEGAFLSRCQR